MYHYIIFFSKTILLFNRAEPPQADEWSQREDEARALDGHQGKEDQGADRQEPRVRGREADEEARTGEYQNNTIMPLVFTTCQ